MLLVVLAAVAIVCAVGLLWWTVSLERPANGTATRNLTAGLGPPTDLRQAVLARSGHDRAVEPAVSWLAQRARRLTPAGKLEALERRILLAGAPQGWTLERVLAAKVGLGAGAAAVAGLLLLRGGGPPTILTAAILVTLGFFGPDLALKNRAEKRQHAVRNALPDTLDQLTISVEAGLAFEAAVARAGRTTNGALADELVRMLQDVQAGMNRMEAMRAMADRVHVSEVRTFVTAVLQAEQYGVPIAKVLRVQAGELRVQRRRRAEERAMKLPVKILFPTVLCIFPTLFIVLLGPAAIQIFRDVFGKL
jgi:tight adherence protein C